MNDVHILPFVKFAKWIALNPAEALLPFALVDSVYIP